MPSLIQNTRTILGAISFAVLTTVCILAMPIISHADETASMLQPGEYIQGLAHKRAKEPFVLQRLTERTYMVSVRTHNSTFYVSDTGVLVFDPLSEGMGQKILDAIRFTTDLPVTGLVYSHYHTDHLADAQLFVDAAKAEGVSLRIIAPMAVAEQGERYGNAFPVPTEIIQKNPGSFSFGKLSVRVETLGDTHSVDNTMFLLEQEKVLVYPDTVEPEDLLPFFRLVGILEVVAMEEALRYVKTLDWEFLNTGHGNVGSKGDIDRHLELINDIRDATGTALKEVPFEKFIAPPSDAMLWVYNFQEAVADSAVEKLRLKYGKQPRFDAVMRSHVEVMTHNLIHYPSK